MAAAAIKEAKDLHTKCEAIWNTRRALLGGRFVSVKMEVEGQMRTLTSAYAPAKPIAGIPMSKRPVFFAHLKKLLKLDTILRIDANCVPDPNLDTRRDAMSAYDNVCAKELAQAVDEKGLVDITSKAIAGPRLLLDLTPDSQRRTVLDSDRLDLCPQRWRHAVGTGKKTELLSQKSKCGTGPCRDRSPVQEDRGC